MPLTGVGKIFKPTLKLREVKDALTEALRLAEVPLARLDSRTIPAWVSLWMWCLPTPRTKLRRCEYSDSFRSGSG